MIIKNSTFNGDIAKKFEGGGNSNYPYQSLKLHDYQHIVIWGDKEKWTTSVINKVKEECLHNRQPWFCQTCGLRSCNKCGSPMNFPMGSEIIYDNGISSHVAIFPIDPGCINQKYEKYKHWGRNN
ncbi:MAG: hypothetical protein DHS20C13_24160 [Thermodesulfobacteriota bacterium]|nr:MAG: hypothetical protein DHS20C13_24160 [Thermodesulfobacteriota bacterium]